jgi:hypothetical protein
MPVEKNYFKMTPLTKELIKEIAEQLDCGFRCFIHKANFEIISVPDENSHAGMDMEAWAEDLDKVEENFTDYLVIDPPESSDSFRMMEDFVETLPESESLRSVLINALNQHKPFSHFKSVIDNSGAYRQQWFHFKARKLEKWVEENLGGLPTLEE